MPIFTRSQYNKLKEDIQQEDYTQRTQEEGESSNPLYSVSCNPLFDNMDKREKKLFPFNKDMRRTPIDSNDERDEEHHLREVEQDPKFHKALENILECNKEKYFLYLANKGAKLPHDFDTENLKRSLDETPLSDLSALSQQIKALQGKIKDMQEGTTTKTYALDNICPYPFRRCLNMIPFPKHCEIPKFDHYNGKLDPIDHIRDFQNMVLEFSHEDTYLMCLLSRSLGGQSMEWLSKITPPIKAFEELINEFISQYSYNIQHQITMIDLCKAKPKPSEPFITFL